MIESSEHAHQLFWGELLDDNRGQSAIEPDTESLHESCKKESELGSDKKKSPENKCDGINEKQRVPGYKSSYLLDRYFNMAKATKA